MEYDNLKEIHDETKEEVIALRDRNERLESIVESLR